MTEYDEMNPPPLTDDDAPVEARNEPRPEPSKRGQEKKKRGHMALVEPGTEPTDGPLLRESKDGLVLAEMDNIIRILVDSDEWRGVIVYDEFANRLKIVNKPPYERKCEGYWWEDADDLATLEWLQRSSYRFKSRLSLACIQSAVIRAGDLQRAHPLRERLRALPPWDGVERISTWLTSTYGADDTPYVRAVGRAWMVGAVQRAFEPGSWLDYAIVLEGLQGGGKSKSIACLAFSDDWFCDDVGNIGDKEAAERLFGKWIIELGELKSIKGKAVEPMRAYITRRVDTFRPSYGRHSRDFKRQCAFIGTVNPGETGYLYLSDVERRFWPVTVKVKRGDPVNMAQLMRVRDQLWAEALVAYRAGEKPVLDDPLEDEAERQQAERVARNPWLVLIANWLATAGDPVKVTTTQAMVEAIKLRPDQMSRGYEMAVGKCLMDLGRLRVRIQLDGVRDYYYYRPDCSHLAKDDRLAG